MLRVINPGHPAKLLSDNGTQRKAANEELQKVFKTWDWDKLNPGMQSEYISTSFP